MTDPVKIPASTVTVYGAGIAGLTAAHELIERGFTVRVIEPEPDPVNAGECDVGGMARTQWSRVPRLSSRQRQDPAELADSGPIPALLGAEFSRYRASPQEAEIMFSPGSGEPMARATGFLKRRVDELVDLIGRIPVVDPYHRDRLFAPEHVQFAGTWAEDDLPQASLDVIPTSSGDRQVADILVRAEHDRYGTDLERWRRALVVVRCQSLMEGFLEALVEAHPDRFQTVWTPNGRAVAILRVNGATPPQMVARLEGMAVGNALRDPSARPAGRRVVRVSIEHNKLPGEHGYRFFPAFYWHVFDTMRRIPITEAEPREPFEYEKELEEWFWSRGGERGALPPYWLTDTPQGRTVKDNLVPLTYHTIAGAGGEAFQLTRALPTSVRGALQVIRDFQRAMNMSYRDIARMQIKMLQYLTSCTGRRDGYGRMTWLEYLGGPYSEGFKQAMINWPRALVGLQADKADARTYGDVAVQLVLDQVRMDAFRDGTLNGPTSVAWLEPWRRYLQSQGVRFHRGRLIELTFTDDGTVEALELTAGGSAARTRNRGYVVLAVPPVEARQLCIRLRDQAERMGGEVQQEFAESDFAAMCSLLDAGGHVFQLEDLGKEQIGGILQHYSGIQFFLEQDLTLFTGHAYYSEAPWALSSISQVQFRMDAPDPTDGYRGVVSVDVGSWDTPGLGGGASAWYSSSRTIANEVWQQICASMGVGDPAAKRRPSNPRWYHIDRGILRKGEEHGATVALGLASLEPIDEFLRSQGVEAEIARAELHERVARSPILAIDSVAGELRAKAKLGMPYFNRSPYLVSTTGSWERSPGRPGNYKLLYGMVMAGTHMRTYTRLATMEAANESARHAVNAILADYKQKMSAADTRLRLDIRVGEPCKTWPLVDRELPDLEFVKKIDAALLRRGLPHMFEILEVEQIVDELVPREEGVEGAADGSVDVVDKIVGVLEQLGSARPSGAGAFVLAPLQALLDGLRARR